MKPAEIDDLVREAYETSKDCPTPESFLPSLMDAASPAERERIEEHAARCPMCAAERDLAREFEPSPEKIETLRDDVDHVVANLAGPEAIPGFSTRSTGHPSIRASRGMGRYLRSWGLAAAAVFALVLVGLVAVQQPSAPPLPALSEEITVRGSSLEVVRPLGELPTAPESLEWEAVPGAATYRVSVIAVDEAVLFESSVGGRSLSLPDDLVDSLHPAVVYKWRVEAMDEDGVSLAWSEGAWFRVRPGGAPGTSN